MHRYLPFSSSRYEHITLLLHQLHWLKVTYLLNYLGIVFLGVEKQL